jgi:hypothetical protein
MYTLSRAIWISTTSILWVGIVQSVYRRLQVGMAGFRFSTEARIFSLFYSVQTGSVWPTPPPIQRVPGTLFPRVKLERREAEHSTTLSTEVKNIGAIPPLPHTFSWHGAWLIKHLNNFTLLLYCTQVFVKLDLDPIILALSTYNTLSHCNGSVLATYTSMCFNQLCCISTDDDRIRSKHVVNDKKNFKK